MSQDNESVKEKVIDISSGRSLEEQKEVRIRLQPDSPSQRLKLPRRKSTIEPSRQINALDAIAMEFTSEVIVRQRGGKIRSFDEFTDSLGRKGRHIEWAEDSDAIGEVVDELKVVQISESSSGSVGIDISVSYSNTEIGGGMDLIPLSDALYQASEESRVSTLDPRVRLEMAARLARPMSPAAIHMSLNRKFRKDLRDS